MNKKISDSSSLIKLLESSSIDKIELLIKTGSPIIENTIDENKKL